MFLQSKKSKQTCFSERVSNQFTDQFIFWRPQQKNNISRQSISVLSQEAAGIIDHLISWKARCIYIQQAIIFTDELGLKRWKFKFCHHSHTLTYIKEEILRNVWVFFIHTMEVKGTNCFATNIFKMFLLLRSTEESHTVLEWLNDNRIFIFNFNYPFNSPSYLCFYSTVCLKKV